MIKIEFKIGDRVKVRKNSELSYQRKNGIGTISNKTGGYLKWRVKFDNGMANTYNEEHLELVSKSNDKPEDMTRFMAYGTGCDNKSSLYKTEKELKTTLKRVSKDSSWTGIIIGYKLVPLYEAEEKTVLKTFKVTKIKKVKKVKKNGKSKKRR